MADISYVGHTEITDSDGSISQSVTVPANTTYAVACYSGWGGSTADTVSSISLGGTGGTSLYTRANSDDFQDAFIYGFPTSEGSRTFALTMSGGMTEGGIAMLVFLGGDVDTGNPVVATGYAEQGASNPPSSSSLATASIATVAGGIGLAFSTGYDYSVSLSMTAQSQTQIVSSGPYNGDLYGSGYKVTTGSNAVFGVTRGSATIWYSVWAVTLRLGTGAAQNKSKWGIGTGIGGRAGTNLRAGIIG